MTRRLVLAVEFLQALFRAAPHLKRLPPLGGVVRGLWVLLGFGKVVQAELEQRRLRACNGCPNYHPQHLTCGTPPSDYGCWCYMPLKAKLPEANCWLYETNPNHPDHMGWPKELNGDILCRK